MLEFSHHREVNGVSPSAMLHAFVGMNDSW